MGKSIHSFIQTISIAPLQVHYYSEVLPTQHGYCAGVPRRSATGNRKLRTCQGPYMVARAGFELTTLRLKGIDSTNAPPPPTVFNVNFPSTLIILVALLCIRSNVSMSCLKHGLQACTEVLQVSSVNLSPVMDK